MFRLFRDSLIRLTDRDLFIRMETRWSSTAILILYNYCYLSLKNNRSPIFAKQRLPRKSSFKYKTFPLLIKIKPRTFIVYLSFSASPIKYIADNMLSYDILKDLNTVLHLFNVRQKAPVYIILFHCAKLVILCK